MPTQFVTLKQAGELLSTDEQTLRRWIAAGLIPAYRMGPRQIRIRRDDLDALLSPIPTRAAQ